MLPNQGTYTGRARHAVAPFEPSGPRVRRLPTLAAVEEGRFQAQEARSISSKSAIYSHPHTLEVEPASPGYMIVILGCGEIQSIAGCFKNELD